MKIHHLHCFTLCPFGGRALWGHPPHMVGHVLAIETEHDGLVLVDTGLGLDDFADPKGRLGLVGRFGGLVVEPERTAIRQIEALGYAATDVRHIVVTHFDLDHAGGIPDFPNATVHLLRSEQEAALNPPTFPESQRYRRPHVQAVAKWQTYEGTGEAWHGFPAAQPLEGLREELVIVPLIGHSRGHAAVGVRQGEGWLLHCGDAYFNRKVMLGARSPRGPRIFERLVAWDYRRVLKNHERLREAARDPALTLFSAHDPTELSACLHHSEPQDEE
ncbi:MAG: MBL fold metallo-hydrolase [Deltaproteobacteria bacterium]|nr:MAG: MBL fold metallo-hydrolase [Deltaproteobacteria bacterium]